MNRKLFSEMRISLFFIFSCVFTNSAIAQNTNGPDWEIPTGSGIHSPFKISIHPTNEDAALVLTGGGEFFGHSFLHIIDRVTGEELETALAVGQNGSDMELVDGFVYVLARTSNELYKISLAQWEVVDVLSVGYRPISIAAIPGERFVVANHGDGLLSLIELVDGKLAITKSFDTNGVLYDVYASSGLVYAVKGNTAEVIELDTELNLIRTFETGGSPSFGVYIVGNRIFVLDRDGGIFVIDKITGVQNYISLALKLGLSEQNLRGIDPFDIFEINSDELVIINNRQDSLILDITTTDPEGVYTYPLIHRLPSGTKGVYLSSTEELYVVRPSSNTLVKCSIVSISTNLGCNFEKLGTLNQVSAHTTGSLNLIGIIDSRRQLTLRNIVNISEGDSGSTTFKPQGSWFVIEADPGSGGFQGARSTQDGYELVLIDSSMEITQTVAIDKIPFSIAVGAEETLLLNRLQGTVTRVGISNSQVDTLTVVPRPREAVQTNNGDWLIVHDTSPNLGITRLTDSDEIVYKPLALTNDWIASIAHHAQSDEVYVASAKGHLAKLDENLSPTKLGTLQTDEVSSIDISPVTHDIILQSISNSAVFKIDKTTLVPISQHSGDVLTAFHQRDDESAFTVTSKYLQYWGSPVFTPYAGDIVLITEISSYGPSCENNVKISWNTSGSGQVNGNWVYVGTEAGSYEIWNSGLLSAETNFVELPSLPSQSVHFSVYTLINNNWIETSEQYQVASDAGGRPACATLIAPNGLYSDNDYEFFWNTVDTATYYQLWINGSIGNLYKSWLTSSIANCANGEDVCNHKPAISIPGNASWWIRTWNSSGYGQWSEPLSFSSAIPTPVIAPTPGSVLATPTENFSWDDTSNSITAWWLYVGTSLGGTELENSGQLVGANAYTTLNNNLPLDSVPIFVRLWYRANQGGWKYLDAEYMSGP